MRQAGRSLPEYRALRERHSFWDVAGTPELCAEVTLQPVRRHGVDAAVMFADIMTPVVGMGLDVELVEGVGPVIGAPVRTLRDVEALRVPDPEEAFAAVLEAVRIGSAITGPTPSTSSTPTPIATTGVMMSANITAASTPWRRTGCSVTSAVNSADRLISKKAWRSRISRYSGRDRPACRMNHTGVRSTDSRRTARTSNGSTRLH